MSKKPEPEMATATVCGRTLQEAKDNVRKRYGRNALIVRSRKVQRPAKDGLGVHELVEIVVALQSRAPAARKETATGSLSGLGDALESEVERVEALVKGLREEQPTGIGNIGIADSLQGYPLARDLLTRGASMPAVRHLSQLYSAEKAGHGSALKHLQSVFRTSRGRLKDLSGCHVFLGDSGAGKTEMILTLAARLTRLSRKVLVLSLYPKNKGEVRRLQEEAAQGGYDAALLRDGGQMMSSLELLDRYDVVLVDTPARNSDSPQIRNLRDRLADENKMHRHFVVAVDHDIRDAEYIWRQARNWNCDWLALTRMDIVRNPGKLLDLLLTSPLCVSLGSRGFWPDHEVDVATGEWLVNYAVTGHATTADPDIEATAAD